MSSIKQLNGTTPSSQQFQAPVEQFQAVLDPMVAMPGPPGPQGPPGPPGPAGSPTPWTTDIDGQGHDLNNAGILRPSGSIELKASGSNPGAVLFKSSTGSTRWILAKTGFAESGSNVGSDLTLERYADNGLTSLGNAIVVTRSTGEVNVPGNIKAGRVEIKADASPNSGLAELAFTSPGGARRWSFGKAPAEAESGGNAGSYFKMARYADDGSLLSAILTIKRSTNGPVTFYSPVGLGGVEAPAYPLDVAGDVNVTGGAYKVNGLPLGVGPAASAYITGVSPTFLAGVSTAVPFNATEFDSSGSAMHSNSVNNTRLLVPTTGYYLAIASHQFNSGATGTVAKLVINGTTDVTGSQTQAVITAFVTAAVTVCLYLTAGQYVEYFITAVSTDAPVFTFTDAPRAAARFQLIRLF